MYIHVYMYYNDTWLHVYTCIVLCVVSSVLARSTHDFPCTCTTRHVHVFLGINTHTLFTSSLLVHCIMSPDFINLKVAL